MPSEDFIAKDKARTAELLADTSQWPQDPVCMKTLPWLPGPQQFGVLRSDDLTTVFPEKGGISKFPSVDAMLDVWTVD
jgi:hypothetical protein